MAKDTRFISFGLCIGMCLGTILAQGLQPDYKSRYSVSTFISTMSSELTSMHGNCSFPPSDVLTNVNSYDFLQMCDRKMPLLDKPVSDGDVIMCLGLLELSLRLCTLERKYFKNDVLFALPSNSDSFNSLILALNQQDGSNLCINLKKVLDALDGINVSEGLLKKWSLQKVFHEKEESCSRICFDYTNKPQLLCKLILWGSNVLLQPEPKTFQALISNTDKGSVGLANNSLISIEQTNKSGHATSSNQDAHNEQESQDDAHSTKNDVKTSTNVMSSSFEIESVGQAMVRPVLNHTDGKSEISNKTVQKENNVKTSNGENQTPIVMVSAEGMKNTDAIAGPSTANNEPEVIINENPQNPMTKPADTSLIESNKPKDTLVNEKSATGPGGKMPTDISPQDEFRDHYDSSFDQNQDVDDDINFPIEQEQPAEHRETTGSKTDYKYPQDQLTNANTFLQERFEDSEDSHFFTYFIAMVVLCIVGYVLFHNKQKILALALEGRSRRTTRRRPATANYHKLDNNLEEAVSSPCNTSVTHVIY